MQAQQDTGREQQISPQEEQKFRQICEQAAALAQDYQRQSTQLQTQIAGMVEVYNRNRSPEQAVPVDKIMEITRQYQTGMREVQQEYSQLSAQLRQEQNERNEMMNSITECFAKLQKMESLLAKKFQNKAAANSASIQGAAVVQSGKETGAVQSSKQSGQAVVAQVKAQSQI